MRKKFNQLIALVDDDTRPLVPHEAAPELEILSGEITVPTILISFEAYRDVQFIIEASGDEEVGWLGTVERKRGERYVIGNIFLFRQQVSRGHCEFDQSDIGQFYNEMLKKDPENKALLNSILFWGHLHPGDMTEPSTQDEEQMALFAHNPFFIRGIFTRNGKCVFTFFNYKNNLKVTDCPWKLFLDDRQRRRVVNREIKKKVRIR